ncbi:nucleoid-associated protein [Bradyrhizobium vignae]|uniref:Nucleoid-associated protein n=1 Tax=Bradyrhizobium vignae TaxID=1549949 RepID=A0ABS4A222_9BRAD|nr:nucleoid-associated protein [Bradyrhizobium vignae]MBP0114458.1 nucleoid-associated protein [Bradyrhizobium vignae]
MFFENLTVDRLIIHEVHRRLDDRQIVPPTYGSQILSLSAEAMDFFRERVVAALGSNSQSMQMAISPLVGGCALEIAADLLVADDENFIALSCRYADKLTSAQSARNIPGGVVVVFTGSAGNPARRVVGVIKAETHSGFRHTQTLQVQYLKDLFLGPQTKLFKIGAFLYDGSAPRSTMPAGWEAVIYDKQMSPKNREGAANYFYESFLGCAIPVNSAQLTRRFFEGTREFINGTDVSDERKADLLTGLYTYLKVDQSPTLELATFSSHYLDADMKDDYETFMLAKSFPSNAVAKDTSDIQGYLKKRRLKFSRDIQLSAPPDAFAELIEVRSINVDASGVGQTWTQITIRDRVRDQE